MATVYLNASTGNDSNTYVQAQNPATPWLTFGKVQSSATTGDTVSVAAGTYTLANVTWTKSFTFNGPALVNGQCTAIVDAALATVCWQSSVTITLNRIRFTRWVGTQAYHNLLGGSISANAIWNLNNCEFIANQPGSPGITGGQILGFKDGVGNSATSVIYNLVACVFAQNQRSSGSAQAYLIEHHATQCIVTATACVFDHDSSANPLAAVLHIQSSNASSSVYKDCVFQNRSGVSTPLHYVYGSGASPLMTYSCANGYSSVIAGTGNITSDPLMVDPANSNFNLRPTSPCIDAGIVP